MSLDLDDFDVAQVSQLIGYVPVADRFVPMTDTRTAEVVTLCGFCDWLRHAVESYEEVTVEIYDSGAVLNARELDLVRIDGESLTCVKRSLEVELRLGPSAAWLQVEKMCSLNGGVGSLSVSMDSLHAVLVYGIQSNALLETITDQLFAHDAACVTDEVPAFESELEAHDFRFPVTFYATKKSELVTLWVSQHSVGQAKRRMAIEIHDHISLFLIEDIMPDFPNAKRPLVIME